MAGKSRCTTPLIANPSTVGHGPNALRSTNKGVKHVIANLEASMIERRPVSSCDNSMHSTVDRTKARLLKEPTNFAPSQFDLKKKLV